jgi:hypothetical protein
MRILGICTTVLLLTAWTLAAPPSGHEVDQAHIDKLIKQLGSRKFNDRAAASRELDKIGEPALKALETATHSHDAEVRSRAETLVKAIQERVENKAALAPEHIHLRFKDTPVEQAVAEVAKQSHYTIQLVGDKRKLKDRKVTLDTGETTFWKAYDQFCDKAGLVEGQPQMPFVRPHSVPMIRPRPLPPVKGGAAAPAPARPAVVIAAAPPLKAPMIAMKMLPRGFVPNGVLFLMDGKPKQVPTSYFGAVRVRVDSDVVRAPTKPAGAQDVTVNLEVSPEPRIRWQSISTIRSDKAVDDNAQALSMLDWGNSAARAFLAPPTGPGGIRPHFIVRRGGWNSGHDVFVRLKAGTNPSKTLKELKGIISAQVRSDDHILLTVDHVLKAVNKPVEKKDAGSLKVTEATANKDGTYTIKVELTRPNDVFPGNPVPATTKPKPAPPRVRFGNPPAVGGGRPIGAPVKGLVLRRPPGSQSYNGLALLDAKGEVIRFQVRMVRGMGNVQGFTEQITFIAKPATGQGEPARLVFAGSRMIAVTVPFELKDVPVR